MDQRGGKYSYNALEEGEIREGRAEYQYSPPRGFARSGEGRHPSSAWSGRYGPYSGPRTSQLDMTSTTADRRSRRCRSPRHPNREHSGRSPSPISVASTHDSSGNLGQYAYTPRSAAHRDDWGWHYPLHNPSGSPASSAGSLVPGSYGSGGIPRQQAYSGSPYTSPSSSASAFPHRNQTQPVYPTYVAQDPYRSDHGVNSPYGVSLSQMPPTYTASTGNVSRFVPSGPPALDTGYPEPYAQRTSVVPPARSSDIGVTVNVSLALAGDTAPTAAESFAGAGGRLGAGPPSTSSVVSRGAAPAPQRGPSREETESASEAQIGLNDNCPNDEWEQQRINSTEYRQRRDWGADGKVRTKHKKRHKKH